MTAQVRSLVAEFLGAFVLVFIGALSILAAGGDLTVIAFGFGLALLAGLYAFGEVSGGHFNPAVSLGALLDGRVDVVTFVQYVVAQIAGAVAAALALLWASSQTAVASTATVPRVPVGSAFLLEIVLAAVFVAVILKVTSSRVMGPSAFLGIPLTLAAVHLAIFPSSGASVNPARSLGPAIVGNQWSHIWIYLTAPFLGAVLGWALYRLVTTGSVSIDSVRAAVSTSAADGEPGGGTTADLG